MSIIEADTKQVNKLDTLTAMHRENLFLFKSSIEHEHLDPIGEGMHTLEYSCFTQFGGLA